MRTSLSVGSFAVGFLAMLPAQDLDAPLAAKIEADAYFRIEPHGASAADVQSTRELMCHTIVGLRAMFGAERVDRCLRGVDCLVRLHGKPTQGTDEGTATLDTGVRDGKYVATISILAPGGFSAGYRDLAGFGPGADHHRKVLAHEYSTVLLDRITREKPAGWRFFAAPEWFVQGCEEYLAVAALDAVKRDEALAAYLRRQSDPGLVRFHPQITVGNTYADGATLVHFLFESYGPERVRAVLDAPQESFDAALQAELGVSITQIEARWKVWRERALGRLDWQKVVAEAKTPQAIAEAVVGLDLRRLPASARSPVVDALRTLAGKDNYWQRPADGEPHRVYGVAAGAIRWVLLVSYPGFEIPGVSWMAVHMFDAEWKQVAVDNFPTGYRISLFDLWQERVDALTEPVIVARLGTMGSFGDFTYRQRQYYAIRDGRVALVRVAEEGRDIGRGIFTSAHPWTGPRPVARSETQWIEMLSSSDAADVLEVLTWIGGRHLASSEPRQENVNQESLADAKLWEAVREASPTKERLVELTRSKHPWIEQAAKLALAPPARR